MHITFRCCEIKQEKRIEDSLILVLVIKKESKEKNYNVASPLILIRRKNYEINNSFKKEKFIITLQHRSTII